MSDALIIWLLYVALAYIILGVLFAIPFVLRRIDHIDSSAEKSSWGFRLIVFPGSVALWPFLLRRLASGTSGYRREHTAHKEMLE